MGQRINQQDKAHHQMMLLSRTGSDSVLQNRQGILVELVCWHLLKEAFSSLELTDHLSTERPCDHQKSWNVCLVQQI